ncbi:Retrovirus-related Pol polyprotein from transposon TNT 1-94 [Vitis vinifera]|uniref:Retrovirus-related Pol polyprotein from transposon TNT 1-94 n=1 Tax=Vitis vinifera TaxID=29760 RepID=A0A438HC54_VITVI|nr:Retrovirus-related Pol polyprotein from transposon TNT 1-94 [Vitis vinifera]
MFPHLFQGLDISEFHCETCELAKHTRVSFPISNKRSSHPFHLIHSDIWGPSTIPNVSGARWFVSLIDDCTQGILHDSLCVNTPQQNGVAERKNGHLLNTTRALLFQGNVPKSYWGEVVLIATYMINRIPSRVLDNKSPVEILKSFYPHFRTSNGLTPRVFGCTAFVHVHSQHRDKLDPRAIKCVFLGYSSTQKGYKCYNPLARKFYIFADVTFTENKPFFHKSSLQGEISMMEDSPYVSFEPLDLPHVSTHGDEEPVSSSVPASVTHNFPQFPKVYSREKAIPEQKQVQESNSDLGNEITVRSDPPLHTQPGETSTNSTDNLDLDLPIVRSDPPLHTQPGETSIDSTDNLDLDFPIAALTKREWKDAMREEMSALEKNKTWEIVERPKGKNIVDCKWIFTLKYKANGSLERHKARLVAKGYTQTYGVDYQETFAPVAKMNTVRILLSLAAHYNWQLLQYDVKNAFLHGDLDEEIYMNIPPGFEENTGNKVCKLKKALYGLKQSPRAWFGRFAKVMKESRYKQSQGDHTLFIKHSATGGVTALLGYVDDIIVTGNDEREKHEVK